MRYKNFYFLLLMVIISSCSSVREYVGIDREAPNEYESLKHESLEIPQQCVLTDPKPGARRPQHQSILTKTKQIVVQNSSPSKNTPVSKSETILLQQIGTTEKKQDNIRETIDREAHHEPSLREKIQKSILFWKKPKKGKVINPEEEKEAIKENSSAVSDPLEDEN